MAKTKAAAPKPALNWKAKRFAKSKFVLAGHFSYTLPRQRAVELIKREGGQVQNALSADVDYLVLGGGQTGTSAIEKKAAQLNQNQGASISVIETGDLALMVAPTREECLAMLAAGKAGRKRLDWLRGGYTLSTGKRVGIDLTRADLRGCDLSGLQLEDGNLDGADLRNAQLSGISPGKVQNARFDGAQMQDCWLQSMTGCSFKNADLSDGFGAGDVITRCDFSGATLHLLNSCRCDWRQSRFRKADFEDADLQLSDFRETDFTAANLAGAKLVGCDFSQACLRGANLSGADLSTAKLVGADLTRANLKGAVLAGADLSGAIVDGATFQGAHVGGATFDRAAVGKAKHLDVSRTQPAGAIGPNLKQLEQVAKQAQRLDTGVSLTLPAGTAELRVRSNRSYLMVEATLGSSEFDDYVANGSLAKKMLELAGRYAGGELLIGSVAVKASKSPIKGSELKQLAVAAWCEAYGAEVASEKELAEAARSNKTDKETKREANLKLLRGGAKGVTGWNDLSQQDRESPAPYRNADLAQANLRSAQLGMLDFQKGNFRGANMSRAYLKSGNFTNANFENANLTRSKCSHAKLTGANLGGASMQQGEFTRCGFRRANLVNANLQGADLAGADLCGADLSGANVMNVEWAGATYDGDTKLPSGFVHQDEMVWKGPGHPPGTVAKLKAARPAGPIDLESFMERLQERVDASRLSKALKMLKSDRFQLFADVQTDHVVGVVKSQTDASLVYSCRLAADGTFACCTQNLNVCGGLHGKPCKHLLVLIIGLTQAEKLDPTTVDEWIDTSCLSKPELNKDVMSETLLRYKGAEAGEIDWRPTETVPEDFYAY